MSFHTFLLAQASVGKGNFVTIGAVRLRYKNIKCMLAYLYLSKAITALVIAPPIPDNDPRIAYTSQPSW